MTWPENSQTASRKSATDDHRIIWWVCLGNSALAVWIPKVLYDSLPGTGDPCCNARLATAVCQPLECYIKYRVSIPGFFVEFHRIYSTGYSVFRARKRTIRFLRRSSSRRNRSAPPTHCRNVSRLNSASCGVEKRPASIMGSIVFRAPAPSFRWNLD